MNWKKRFGSISGTYFIQLITDTVLQSKFFELFFRDIFGNWRASVLVCNLHILFYHCRCVWHAYHICCVQWAMCYSGRRNRRLPRIMYENIKLTSTGHKLAYQKIELQSITFITAIELFYTFTFKRHYYFRSKYHTFARISYTQMHAQTKHQYTQCYSQ